MKVIPIILLLFLCGCEKYSNEVAKYTQQNPGVSCRPVDFKGGGIIYKDGKRFESDATFYYECTNGRHIERKGY